MYEFSDNSKLLAQRLTRFMDEYIYPNEEAYAAQLRASVNRFAPLPLMDELKSKAKDAGLWNLFVPVEHAEYCDHGGLSFFDYAPLAEIMGRVIWCPEVFNCNAPDTGNMEVLERYGTAEHKDRWLNDLLDGKIRSAYVMTEPNTASSDAAQLSFEAKKDGDEWVLNGEKWWISGSGDPRCALYIVMACSDPDAPKHSRHTMFVMDADTPGVEILRPMQVFGHDDAPHGHMHLRFTNVRLPASAVVLGEGRGFEVAQGRLGPGRIHHCMRAIGQAEKALEMMCKRGLAREAFGKKIIELGANYDIIANARMEIEMARLLCLKAAYMMDTAGVRAAQPWISKIKVVAPLMAGKVIDEAMQLHGAAGISQDTDLAHMWTHVRTLRFADGPDAVHRRQVARAELKKYSNEKR